MENTVNFDVLEAICTISKKLKKSQLKGKKLVGIKTKLNQLNGYLQTTDNETFLFIAIFTLKYNYQRGIALGDLAIFFDYEGIDILLCRKDLLALREKHYIIVEKNNRDINLKTGEIISFESNHNIHPLIEISILENKPVPEKLYEDLDSTNESFVESIFDLLTNNVNAQSPTPLQQVHKEIIMLEKRYSELRVVKKLKPILHKVADRILFYYVCSAWVLWEGNALLNDSINLIYLTHKQRIEVTNKARNKTHLLFEKTYFK